MEREKIQNYWIYFIFLAAPHGIQDLSPLARDGSHALCNESKDS